MKDDEKYSSAARHLDETRQLLLGRQREPESLSDRIKYRRSAPLADWFDQFGSMGTFNKKKNR